jgi:hypothetical protein
MDAGTILGDSDETGSVPIDFLQHVMEARGMTRKNLEP